MAESLELEIATPERELVHEQVTDVQVPGKDGYLGILPGHAALLGQLGAGALSYSEGGGPRRYLAIDGGYLEVLDNHVRVLADLAERAEDINVERARTDLSRAQEQLGSTAPDANPDAALTAFHRAQARIDAAEHR